MERVAFLFNKAPHGSSSGKEGLDAVLAMSAFNKEIALFFIGDGVLQLNYNQQPEVILARNYITTFSLLPLCDVTQYFICKESLLTRGQKLNLERILPTTILYTSMLYKKLITYHHIISF
ncbi:sulfurtransferase complex subunit TusC [Pantoea sp. Aalb]|uniref:sulfurtransferase complex subunit TusC n=1 Tax=Pantoea sp. Aalb TaxID=2576762 RepID=UPI001322E54C|nr:sulfurtransferase complex subunit TusC [Pantoea sp. Aalb]MXP67873.1 sulfurtransferase complex subunit TusC [Pantoea sp. Aalb]